MRDIDLSALRARLTATSGPAFWRSLDELAETDEFKRYVEREFPEHASEWNDPAGRRQFLKLMGASLALAGITGCTRQPAEKILPYVSNPEGVVPGKPLLFATAMPKDGYAEPVLAVSHMGRPTKIEPNPDHPATGGGTSLFAQASVLDLYDPDRSQTIRFRGAIRSFTDFTSAVRGALTAQGALQGEGIRILTGTVTSPTLAAQVQQILDDYPLARWVQDDPVSRDAVREGAELAFGQALEPRYHFDAADVVVLLDADPFDCGPGQLRYAREFAARRNPTGEAGLNRLYVVESRTSNAGTKADHRLPVRAADVDAVARAIAAGLGVAGASAAALPAGVSADWVRAVVDDLRARGARALVVAGDQQPAPVHVLAHAINAAVGAVGTTVDYLAPVAARPEGRTQTLAELTADMAAGTVDLLLVLDGNPVYTAPADLAFAEHFQKVALRIHVGLHVDETAALSHWHIPATHYLEQWGDVRAFDGTVTICQPLIAPLYDTCRSPHEVLAAFGDNPQATAYEILRERWEAAYDDGTVNLPDGSPFETFDKAWRRVVHDGYVAGTAAEVVTPGAPAAIPPPAVTLPADAIEVTFSADPTIHDGRYANNGWLQETPKPLNKMTWDNVVIVSPRTAEALGLRTQNLTRAEATLAEVSIDGRTISAPVWVQVGHPDGSVNLQLGFGRERAGRVGTGIGYNANAVRMSAAPWIAAGSVTNTGTRYRVASSQLHFSMENRHLVRTASLATYQAEPDFAQHIGHTPKYEDTLHGNEWTYDGYKWGMVIDLNACDGCNACVVACTSENNIPVVGKEQVAVGREMHWIRIDRYYEGNLDNPTVHDQPINCMQCENAPCEVVCPVAATVHSEEGLNDMVYNRCVGTRYCANNCPYKVRRFNFLLYADWDTPTLKMVRNPEVTVRSRGVMEKCTYCVQRITSARIQAKLEDRRIRDGDVRTACQTACPTQAITFGDMNDPESAVAKAKADPRNYGLLEDLNTRPRTTYLAAVRNPNPVIEPAAAQAAGHGPETH